MVSSQFVPQRRTCFHLKHFGQQIKRNSFFGSSFDFGSTGRAAYYCLDRYHNSNLHGESHTHKKCMGVISQASISLHYSIPALNLKSKAHQALYKQNVLNWIWGLLTNHCAVAQKLVCFCESYLIEGEESKISSHSLPFHLSPSS